MLEIRMHDKMLRNMVQTMSPTQLHVNSYSVTFSTGCRGGWGQSHEVLGALYSRYNLTSVCSKSNFP